MRSGEPRWFLALALLVPGSVQADRSYERDERCQFLGAVMARIAVQRDAGVSPEVAKSRTANWARKVNRTGSNVDNNFAAYIDAFTPLVFAYRDLTEASLYHYGVNSCGFGLSGLPARRINDASARLRDHALACQAKHPAESRMKAGYKSETNPLAVCITRAARAEIARR